MGRNAARRRDAKAALKLVRPRARRPTETRTVQRLRERLAFCETRLELEGIIADALPEHRPAVRVLVERLAPTGLPCCGRAMLSARQHETPVQHAKACPVGGLVVIAT